MRRLQRTVDGEEEDVDRLEETNETTACTIDSELEFSEFDDPRLAAPPPASTRYIYGSWRRRIANDP